MEGKNHNNAALVHTHLAALIVFLQTLAGRDEPIYVRTVKREKARLECAYLHGNTITFHVRMLY